MFAHFDCLQNKVSREHQRKIIQIVCNMLTSSARKERSISRPCTRVNKGNLLVTAIFASHFYQALRNDAKTRRSYFQDWAMLVLKRNGPL